MKLVQKVNFILTIEICLLIFTVIFNYQLFNTTKIVGNGASRTLVAIGPILNIGVPYKDLYEFAPPGYYMLVGGWASVFGTSMVSYRSLQAFLIIIHGICVLLICKKLFRSKLLSFLIFSSTIIAVHSPLVQSDIYSVDLAATAFALAGLTTIFYLKNVYLKLSLGSMFMLIAFQMKDIYILSLITLVPLYLREFVNKSESKFYKIVLMSLLGPIFVTAIIITYLVKLDIYQSYIEVFKDKMGVAHHYNSLIDYYETNKVILTHFNNFFVPNSIKIGTIFLIFNCILGITFLMYKIRKSKTWYGFFSNSKKYGHNWLNSYSETRTGSVYASVLFVFSLLGGLTLYGQYSVDTRFIPIATCLYILLGVIISPIFDLASKTLRSRFLIFGLFIIISVLILPKKDVVAQLLKPFPNPPPYNFEVENEIISRTNSEDCILHIYGWEVSSTYIYTRRRPCTRYFLINHLSLFGKRRLVQEYKQQIFENPPKVLIINRLGADFDIAGFEKNILNIPEIVKNCYTIDPKYRQYKGNFFAPVDIFWPKSDLSRDQLKECVYKSGRV